VAVSLGVLGMLTADKVVEYGSTALAEAAKPVLGQAGYVGQASFRTRGRAAAAPTRWWRFGRAA
jgi:hypothetical protein